MKIREGSSEDSINDGVNVASEVTVNPPILNSQTYWLEGTRPAVTMRSATKEDAFDELTSTFKEDDIIEG